MHLTPEPSLQTEVGCYQVYMYLDVIRALFFLVILIIRMINALTTKSQQKHKVKNKQKNSYQPEVITQRFLLSTSRKFLANVSISTYIYRCIWLYRHAIGHITYQIFNFLVLFKSVHYRSFPSACVMTAKIYFTA